MTSRGPNHSVIVWLCDYVKILFQIIFIIGDSGIPFIVQEIQEGYLCEKHTGHPKPEIFSQK